MIAFKIHSGRKTDIRDIIMLNENINLEKILNHMSRGDNKLLKNQINNINRSLNDPNLYDSLKGVFQLSAAVKKQIDNAKKLFDSLAKSKYLINS